MQTESKDSGMKELTDEKQEAAVPDTSTKSDPHGYPLRPQPSEDPLGTPPNTFLCKKRLLRHYRPPQLAAMAQDCSTRSGLFPCLPWAVLPSGHQQRFLATLGSHGHQHHSRLIQHNHRNFVCWCGSHILVTARQCIWSTTDFHRRQRSRHYKPMCLRGSADLVGHPDRESVCRNRYKCRNGDRRSSGIGYVFHAREGKVGHTSENRA